MHAPLGFIGTGLLGLPMAARLVETGLDLIVYNRTRAKTARLAEAGATIGGSPREVIHSADTTILMVSDAPAIEAVLDEIGDLPLGGKTIIQMGTIAPEESRGFMARIEARGGMYLEAPVLGSIPQAEGASLMVMVGGTEETFEAHLDLLARFGPDPVLVGPVGSAAALKLALNQLIASLTAAFSLSYGLVREHAIDEELFMGILRRSALYAPTFDKKLDKMRDRDFTDPNFPLKHMAKDVGLVIRAAQAAGLDTAAVEGVGAVIGGAMARHADDDYSSLYEGVHPPRRADG